MSNLLPQDQVPRGWLSRSQIVDIALKKAGNTALKSAPTYMAQCFLNETLHTLYTLYDLPFLYTTADFDLTSQSPIPPYITLPVPSTTYTDPSDPTKGFYGFARATTDDAFVIISLNGEDQYLPITQLDRITFNRYVGNRSARGVPDSFTIDANQRFLYFWPMLPSDGTYWSATGRLSYQRHPRILELDLTDDATIPEFPWSDYLIDALVARVYEFENDSRATTELLKAEARLKKYLDAAHPHRSSSPTIPLDETVFKDYPS